MQSEVGQTQSAPGPRGLTIGQASGRDDQSSKSQSGASSSGTILQQLEEGVTWSLAAACPLRLRPTPQYLGLYEQWREERKVRHGRPTSDSEIEIANGEVKERI